MTAFRWKLFQGTPQDPTALTEMPPAPAWRSFMDDQDFESEIDSSHTRWEKIQALAEKDVRGKERGESFRLDASDTAVVNAMNAALHLRRPLLVTGKPGSGKTSLAYAVANELKLGVVLSWPINARSLLKDALYQYDAVARLQDVNLNTTKEMGQYIRLGPVGTAFLPSHLPRVLLIDEIDKCDINLPNDLLNLFEEGRYEIPELVRCKDEEGMGTVSVRTADADVPAVIRSGRVFCREFPLVVMTSNGERDFPPAFLRRCIRLRMPDPSQKIASLERIVEAHLKRGADTERWDAMQDNVNTLVESFVKKGRDQTADIATDQLLNVVYLLTREVSISEADRAELQSILLKGLSEEE